MSINISNLSSISDSDIRQSFASCSSNNKKDVAGEEKVRCRYCFKVVGVL